MESGRPADPHFEYGSTCGMMVAPERSYQAQCRYVDELAKLLLANIARVIPTFQYQLGALNRFLYASGLLKINL